MTLLILGLGPGPVEDLSLRAWRTLEKAKTVFLRTERHPCVPQLPQGPRYESFDSLYESLTEFDDVYNAIVARMLKEAENDQDVVYAVPGDPFVGESTTIRLLQAAREHNLQVEIISGISFIEPMLRHLGVDALDGLQILDGITVGMMHHPPINPDFPAFLGQIYSRDVASNVKLTLMNQYPDDFPVTLIHSAGTTDAHIESLPLYEIDRSRSINHLTSLYLPAAGEHTSFEAFQEIIAHLRAPEGCPWDRKQTHESLRPYLLEEAYEVLEAIDDEDPNALAGELGDLLLQIVLHTQIAIEDGEFLMTDVMRHINQKMIRRHPHVWGEVDVDGNAERVVTNWEEIKKQEKAANGAKPPESVLDGVPKGAPSLWVAHKYQDKAARVGFDWPDVSGVEAKAQEEMAEILAATTDAERAAEIGDLMFVLVNWLRWLKVDDPESLLRSVNSKFYRRFRFVEDKIAEAGRSMSDCTLDEMDQFWNMAKAEGL